MFVDTHAHLMDGAFDEDREQVYRRALDAGMPFLVVVGYDPATSRAAARFAAEHPRVLATCGVHPHQASAHGVDASRQLLEELDGHPRVVAFGEMGLDYYYDHSTPEDQRAVFRAQLDAARERDRPVVVHVRDAEEDALELLSSGGWPTGIWHCFCSSRAAAERALEGGMYLSFSGMITFPWADTLREVARSVPADRLLVETDSPWLAPVPERGTRCHPALVEHTGRKLAELRGVEPEELAAVTTANARRLFGAVAEAALEEAA